MHKTLNLTLFRQLSLKEYTDLVNNIANMVRVAQSDKNLEDFVDDLVEKYGYDSSM